MFIAFGVIDYYFITDKETFNSITASVQAVIIIAMCIYYFFDQLKEPMSIAIYSSLNFWVILSFLIYLSGTFFLYLMAANMIHDKEFFKQYVIINTAFNIIKNILLSAAMVMKINTIREDRFPDESLESGFPDINTLKNLN